MSKQSKTHFPKFLITQQRARLTDLDLYGRTPVGMELPKLTGDVVYEIAATGNSEQEAIQNLRDIRQKEQEQQEAAVRAQHERSREEARAREPKSCPRIFSAGDLLELRPDPELIAMCADEPPIGEVHKPVWMTHSPNFFLVGGHLCSEADLIGVVHAYGGAEVKRFSTVKKHLDAYSSINPNPLAIGERPKRKRVVVRFATSGWRRLSFLTRSAELAMPAAAWRRGSLARTGQRKN
jgi:hypothetical protein